LLDTATIINGEFGLDAARAVLGHRDANTTLIYSERDMRLAARVAAKLG